MTRAPHLHLYMTRAHSLRTGARQRCAPSYQASGPTHTYCSGPHSTTVDYIICNQSATFICSSASTLDDHAFNTSNHLPLKVVVHNIVLQDVEQNGPGKKINWTKAESDGSLSIYIQNISSLISPLTGRDYTSIDELDTEISNHLPSYCFYCPQHSSLLSTWQV